MLSYLHRHLSVTKAFQYLVSIPGKLTLFARENRGNVAPLFAAVILPIMFSVGAAIDYSRASQSRIQFQSALDAAALAIGLMPTGSSQSDLEAKAAEVFNVNYSGQGSWGANISVSKVGNIVDLSIVGNVGTFFMGLAHVNSIDLHVDTQVVIGGGTIEVAMVLDNSGSMSGSKLTSLKTAASELVDTLFEDLPANSTDLSFSLTPFATFVDIGQGNINASWMDTQALSSIHSENFSSSANRFDLYDNFTNVQWEGCVEARPYPYDVQDDTPTAATPDTLFVPTFAPDHPDEEDYWYEFLNNYLDDQTGGGDTTRQENVNKYSSGVAASTDYFGTTYNIGPSFLCRQSELVPLTNSQTDIEDGIDNMEARGATNIVQGLVWGWRTLSSGEPFTEGRAYTDSNNQKILILLTDGANTISGSGNFNNSLYSAYGFMKDGRLGTTSTSSSTHTARLNDRTAEACTNVKAAGITIFTITFDLSDSTTIDLMTNCATSTEYYYNSPSASDLDEVFEEIALKLRLLRLSR